MKSLNIKKLLPILIAIGIYLAISISYYPEALQGKVLPQGDVNTWKGGAKELLDYRAETGEEGFWTNSMFSGMPGYLLSVHYVWNPFAPIHHTLELYSFRPVSFLFMTMFLFFLAMLLFGVNPWLSIIGGIAYGFSSYFIIIAEAGHILKLEVLAYIPLMIASIYYTYKKDKWLGAVIFTLTIGIQLLLNHLQMTYYGFLVVLIMVIFLFIDFLKQNATKDFFIRSAFLVIATLFAIGINFPKLALTYEIAQHSIRGKSELTINHKNKTNGLDKDYITQWSYGIGETLTLLTPYAKGGSSTEAVGKESETYKLLSHNYPPAQLKQITKHLPLYWGDMPFTAGPVYAGSILIFLFVLGLFLIKGSLKWWILTATILSIMLAWGKHFMWLTDLFINYFPMYNKFRAVSSILVIAEFTIPLLAILTLQRLYSDKVNKDEFIKALKWTLGIVGGLLLILWMMPGAFFSFTGQSDAGYLQQGATQFVDALRADRKAFLQHDAIRSLIFILLSAGTLYYMFIGKLKKTNGIITLGLLILIDMWGVDKRYVNNDDFISKRIAKVPYPKTQADEMILRDTSYYRVFNLTVSTFNDASTSYWHKSIGGYNAAKLKRYQELIEYQISKNNMEVLNMLNTKYFIVPNQQTRQPMVQQNPGALGNAWFVKNYKLVPNADSEITALSHFKANETAIVDKRFEKYVKTFSYKDDANAFIKLTDYKPNQLTYEYQSTVSQFVVFSEIYYQPGWQAFIDGKPVDHFRVDYVLRALIVPQGKHTIVFKFRPSLYDTGNSISIISSILFFLILLGLGFFAYKKEAVKKQ